VRRADRLDRIHALQGSRAGFVSRVLALSLDFGLLFFFGFLIVGFVALVRWIATSANLSLSRPHGWFWVAVAFVLSSSYFAYMWATTGRTLGEQLFGLRTIRPDGSRLDARRSLVRGALTVLLPIGILWVLVSRTNASLQDLVSGSVVVYDWSYHPPVD